VIRSFYGSAIAHGMEGITYNAGPKVGRDVLVQFLSTAQHHFDAFNSKHAVDVKPIESKSEGSDTSAEVEMDETVVAEASGSSAAASAASQPELVIKEESSKKEEEKEESPETMSESELRALSSTQCLPLSLPLLLPLSLSLPSLAYISSAFCSDRAQAIRPKEWNSHLPIEGRYGEGHFKVESREGSARCHCQNRPSFQDPKEGC